MTQKKVAVLVGSLRKDSFTRKIAKNIISLAPSNLLFEFVEIGDLPIYNQDLDTDPPRSWTEFRARVKSFDAVLFATPEYNRSVPGVLKNAIDVGSRPYGQSAWEGKPGAVISVSPGASGGFGANHHLRQSLVFLDVPVMQQPEAYIGGVTRLLNDQGEITAEDTKKFLARFAERFAVWIEHNSSKQ